MSFFISLIAFLTICFNSEVVIFGSSAGGAVGSVTGSVGKAKSSGVTSGSVGSVGSVGSGVTGGVGFSLWKVTSILS